MRLPPLLIFDELAITDLLLFILHALLSRGEHSLLHVLVYGFFFGHVERAILLHGALLDILILVLVFVAEERVYIIDFLEIEHHFHLLVLDSLG